MMSFVSSIWVLNEEPTNMAINACTKIMPDLTMDKMLEEFIETFIINQESGKTNVVEIPFAKVYICCRYITYTTNDMAKVFADHGAYEVYVEETMRKLAAALKFVSPTISDYIYSVYN